MLIARDNQTHFLNALRLITVPGTEMADEGVRTIKEKSIEKATLDRSVAMEPRDYLSKPDWLYELETEAQSRQASGRDKMAAAVVGRLLADHRE